MKKESVFIDIICNYTSLLIGGVSGIIINLYLSYFYGPGGLGVFNQIYAVYIVLSQVSVGGVHLSALKYVASWQGSSFSLSRIAWSSFLLALPISIFFALLCYIGSFYLHFILPSPEVSVGVRYVALALVFFSCNKVMLFTLNALQDMKLLALWQGLRFVLMILFVIVLTHFDVNVSSLGFTFTFSEGFLFLGLFATTIYKLPWIHKGLDLRWLKTHFFFGLQGFANGLLLEINTRVDILLLGALTNDIIVGLYSFASMLIEGIQGFLVVVRNQINPVLAKLLKDRKFAEISTLFKKLSLFMYGGAFVGVICAIVLYIPVFLWLLHLDSFLESRYFFFILLGGLSIYSAYFPFENLLLLAGYPGKQSFLAFFSTCSNILLNLCLIPLWGGYGAATATALALVFTLFYLKFMVNKCLRVKLQLLGSEEMAVSDSGRE